MSNFELEQPPIGEAFDPMTMGRNETTEAVNPYYHRNAFEIIDELTTPDEQRTRAIGGATAQRALRFRPENVTDMMEIRGL